MPYQRALRPRIAALSGLGLILGLSGAPGASGQDPVAERAEAIAQMLQTLEVGGSDQDQERIVRALGELRAAEAAPQLVERLVELHRDRGSSVRDAASPGHALTVAIVEALRGIGRPGLEPFLSALANWDAFALDLTVAFVSIHGEEGVLMLRQRAALEPNVERRQRLEAAAWFTRLRAPPSLTEGGEPEPEEDQ